jgi:hypothetical protein
LGAALAIGGSAQACPNGLCDAFFLHSGGVTITRQVTDETQEFMAALETFPTPANFQDGTVWLLEPAKAGGGVSDGFTLVSDPNTGHVNAYAISDGASSAEWALFVVSARSTGLTETGGWQDVSAFFGQAPGFAKILSDVPEPRTWAMLLLGAGALGALARTQRRGKLEASA